MHAIYGENNTYIPLKEHDDEFASVSDLAQEFGHVPSYNYFLGGNNYHFWNNQKHFFRYLNRDNGEDDDSLLKKLDASVIF